MCTRILCIGRVIYVVILCHNFPMNMFSTKRRLECRKSKKTMESHFWVGEYTATVYTWVGEYTATVYNTWVGEYTAIYLGT